MPFDLRIPRLVDAARPAFEAIGGRLEEAFPDLRDARDVFLTMRAHMYAADLAGVYDEHRHRMKDAVTWDIESGLRLTGADIRAEVSQSAAGRHADNRHRVHSMRAR